MIWNDGAAGLPLTMEALNCIAREAEELASLPLAGQADALPGLEQGTEKELAAALAAWAGEALSPAGRERLEEGTAILHGLTRYALERTERLLKYADLALSMNLEAIRGEQGAFDDRLHSLARPFPGQIASAANVRRLLAGSQATTDEGRFAYGYDTAPRVQDAICLRAAPQTHGGARDVFTFTRSQAERDMETKSPSMARTELALSGLITALADLAHISERRGFRLNDSKLSYGLPMNLVVGDVGMNHGYPMVQASQAVSVAELKLMTMPAQLLRTAEESMTWFNLCKLLKAVALTERVLAVEMLMSAQGMDIVLRKVPGMAFGAGTTAARQCLRRRVSVLERNRFMAPDMAAALELLESGELLEAAEAAVGPLQ